jgi:hypothetical protein
MNLAYALILEMDENIYNCNLSSFYLQYLAKLLAWKSSWMEVLAYS